MKHALGGDARDDRMPDVGRRDDAAGQAVEQLHAEKLRGGRGDLRRAADNERVQCLVRAIKQRQLVDTRPRFDAQRLQRLGLGHDDLRPDRPAMVGLTGDGNVPQNSKTGFQHARRRIKNPVTRNQRTASRHPAWSGLRPGDLRRVDSTRIKRDDVYLVIHGGALHHRGPRVLRSVDGNLRGGEAHQGDVVQRRQKLGRRQLLDARRRNDVQLVRGTVPPHRFVGGEGRERAKLVVVHDGKALRLARLERVHLRFTARVRITSEEPEFAALGVRRDGKNALDGRELVEAEP